MFGVVWLRPEYRDRLDELVTFSDAAKEIGVTRATITNWMNRYDDFPKVVLLTGSELKQTKYLVREEIHEYAQRDKTKPKVRSSPTNRSRQEITEEKIRHTKKVLADIREQEERQKDALLKTHAYRRRTEKKLDDLQRTLKDLTG